jgi:hypothetical protein
MGVPAGRHSWRVALVLFLLCALADSTLCPLGKFRDASMSKEEHEALCYECEPGHFGVMVKGIAECLQCPLGKFQGGHGQLACADCPSGTTSAGVPSLAKCMPGGTCDLGKYKGSTGGGSSACSPCPAGKFGEYSAASSSTRCRPCTVGKFSASTGLLACASCPKGKFQPDAGRVACPPCAEGRFSSTAASAACTACAAGRYGGAPALADAACSGPCSHSRFSAASAAHCTTCPRGKFCTGAGTLTAGCTRCHACPGGKYRSSPPPKSAGDGCLTCAKDTYSDAPSASTSCLDCPSGKHCFPGHDKCVDCNAATGRSMRTNKAERQLCAACPVGQQRPAGAWGLTPCALCPPTTFGLLLGGPWPSGVSVCLTCPAGQFTADAGRTRCALCPAGKMAASEAFGQTGQKSTGDCWDCPRGQFSLPGMATCACPSGRYGVTTADTDGGGGGAAGVTSSTQRKVVHCSACPLGTFCALDWKTARALANIPAADGGTESGTTEGHAAAADNEAPDGAQAAARFKGFQPGCREQCTACPAGERPP